MSLPITVKYSGLVRNGQTKLVWSSSEKNYCKPNVELKVLVGEDYQNLLELIVFEEIKSCMPEKLVLFEGIR